MSINCLKHIYREVYHGLGERADTSLYPSAEFLTLSEFNCTIHPASPCVENS